MNKKLNKLLAGLLALGIICSGTALAADPVAVSKDGEKITVTVSGLGSGEETTLLVVPQDVTISQAFADTRNIIHMDQAPASPSGVAAFGFKYSQEGNLDIYSGYATMNADDAPYEGVLDLSGGAGGQPGGEFTYGDVNNDKFIDASDAMAVINNFLHGTAFTYSVDGEKKEYSYGKEAANVNGDTIVDASDAVAIINNFLHGNKFPVNNK